MINETSDSPFPTSGTGSLGGGTSTGRMGMEGQDKGAPPADATVHRMARAAHDAVDRLEQALGSGSERVMDWQREYGEMARDQVRSNPLAAVGVAFGIGILFSKLFMR